MIVSTGNFLFRTRNILFPLLYLALFIRDASVFSHPRAALVTGLVLVLAGQSIRILTVGMDYIVRGGRNKRVYASTLVTKGLFSLCRNPLYLGNLLILTGFGIASGSLWYLFISMPLLYLAYACIIAAEEHFLRQRFGEEYTAYCQQTPRLFPRLRDAGSVFKKCVFNWQRVVVKEYSTLYITFLIALGLSSVVLLDELNPHTVMLPALIGLIATLLCITVRCLKKSGRLSANSAPRG